jgi:hypothetical protein
MTGTGHRDHHNISDDDHPSKDQEAPMALFTWWRSDPLPLLHELGDFYAVASDDVQLLAPLTGLEVTEIQWRLTSHHRPYVAALGGMPVAYGWVALEGADIGELDVQFTLPYGDRYLWDFKT